MLCYLRHPGRSLHANERPPAALVSFVAEQIEVSPETFDDYLASSKIAGVRRANPVGAAVAVTPP
jgi:hypothetical protein